MVVNKRLKRLATVDAVFQALGGTQSICRVFRPQASYNAVNNWLCLYKKFPARTYVALQIALESKGYVGEDNLWGMADAAG